MITDLYKVYIVTDSAGATAICDDVTEGEVYEVSSCTQLVNERFIIILETIISKDAILYKSIIEVLKKQKYYELLLLPWPNMNSADQHREPIYMCSDNSEHILGYSTKTFVSFDLAISKPEDDD